MRMLLRKRIYAVQALLVAVYAVSSFRYFKTWCAQQQYQFSDGAFLLYTLMSLIILLLPGWLNYRWLIDRFEKKGFGWRFYLLQVFMLFATLWMQALLDAVFLRAYHPAWLYSDVHVYSRFFINLCFTLFFSFQKMLLAIFEKKENESKLKLAQMEANLKFLRAQINPHFLFNTLNNIYSYAVQEKKETPGLILKLSEILRYLVEQPGRVSAGKEFEVMQQLAGLYLVNSRWKNRLRIEMEDKQNHTSGFMIEPQSLLSLAENCFKHSNLDEEGAFIHIRIVQEAEGLEAWFSNSIPRQQRLAKKGTGLDNLRQRLEIMYGSAYVLEWKEEAGKFMVHLKLGPLA